MKGSYKVRPMFKYINRHYKGSLVGAEVGVCWGHHAYIIFNSCNIKMLHLVDVWNEKKYPASIFFTQKILEDYIDRCIFYRGRSDRMCKKLPYDLDFVYIDGDHSYDGVKKDIACYSEHVRPGGVIGGHNYEERYVFRVVKAVDEFVDMNELDLKLWGNDWWTVLKKK